jgi:protein TonB
MIHAGRSYLDLEERYRTRLRLAYALSGALHVALLLVTPAALVPRIEAERTGLAGPDRLAEQIAPETDPVDRQEALARWRMATGAMLWVDVEIVGETTGEPQPALAPNTPPAGSPPKDPGRRVTVGPLRPYAPPTPALEIRLDEGLAAVSTSAASARASRFAILDMVRPEYPELSLWAQVEGLVTIRALVDPAGLVSAVSTVDNQADRMCERAAAEALQRWRFQPLRVEGQSVWFTVVVPFRFQLRD